MEMTISEQLLYSTVKICCTYNDGNSGSGTGFIFNFCKNAELSIPCVVTNCHVIENASHIHFEFCKMDKQGNPNNLETIKYDSDGTQWIRHPSGIDLCCLPIGAYLNFLRNRNIDVFYVALDIGLIPDEKTIEDLAAIEETIMVGYPIGIEDFYNHKPIIRKGITATHIKYNYQAKSEFLVDMACFPGSSGSPVFILNEGSYTKKHDVIIGSRLLFVGILYGGPQHQVNGEVALYSLPNYYTKTRIPTNLGSVIKSSELMKFEEIFAKIKKGEKNGI